LNVLKPQIRITIQQLLQKGTSQREIERLMGVDRNTIRRYEREANSPGVATGLFTGGSAAGGGENRSDMAMAYVQAGGKPARETASHRPGIESCRCGGDITLDA
jgi:Helix-turn-helix domain